MRSFFGFFAFGFLLFGFFALCITVEIIMATDYEVFEQPVGRADKRNGILTCSGLLPGENILGRLVGFGLGQVKAAWME